MAIIQTIQTGGTVRWLVVMLMIFGIVQSTVSVALEQPSPLSYKMMNIGVLEKNNTNNSSDNNNDVNGGGGSDRGVNGGSNSIISGTNRIVQINGTGNEFRTLNNLQRYSSGDRKRIIHCFRRTKFKKDGNGITSVPPPINIEQFNVKVNRTKRQWNMLPNDIHINLSTSLIPSNSSDSFILNLSGIHLKSFINVSFIYSNGSDDVNVNFNPLNNIKNLDVSRNHMNKFELFINSPFKRLNYLNVSCNLLTLFNVSDAIDESTNSELKILDLSYNNLSDPKCIMFGKYIEQLEQIDLSCNQLKQLDEIILKNGGQLKFLDLSYNHLVRLHKNYFDRLIALERITLAHNNISYIERDTFGQLPNLQYLDLSFNNIDIVDSVRALQGIPDLVSLSMAYNKRLGNALQQFVSAWTLKVLDASGTGLCQIPAALAQSIHTLRLADNYFEIVRCGDLDSYPLLQHLDLSSNSIIDIEDDALGRLEILKILLLNNNNLTKIPISLPSNLLELHLQYNQIIDLQPNHFAPLQSLRILNLSNNRIAYLPGLPLPKLLTLNIQSSGLKGLSEWVVKVSPQLNDLLLDNNPIKCSELLTIAEWVPPCHNEKFDDGTIKLGLLTDGGEETHRNQITDNDGNDPFKYQSCRKRTTKAVPTPLLNKSLCATKQPLISNSFVSNEKKKSNSFVGNKMNTNFLGLVDPFKTDTNGMGENGTASNGNKNNDIPFSEENINSENDYNEKSRKHNDIGDSINIITTRVPNFIEDLRLPFILAQSSSNIDANNSIANHATDNSDSAQSSNNNPIPSNNTNRSLATLQEKYAINPSHPPPTIVVKMPLSSIYYPPLPSHNSHKNVTQKNNGNIDNAVKAIDDSITNRNYTTIRSETTHEKNSQINDIVGMSSGDVADQKVGQQTPSIITSNPQNTHNKWNDDGKTNISDPFIEKQINRLEVKQNKHYDGKTMVTRNILGREDGFFEPPTKDKDKEVEMYNNTPSKIKQPVNGTEDRNNGEGGTAVVYGKDKRTVELPPQQHYNSKQYGIIITKSRKIISGTTTTYNSDYMENKTIKQPPNVIQRERNQTSIIEQHNKLTDKLNGHYNDGKNNVSHKQNQFELVEIKKNQPNKVDLVDDYSLPLTTVENRTELIYAAELLTNNYHGIDTNKMTLLLTIGVIVTLAIGIFIFKFTRTTRVWCKQRRRYDSEENSIDLQHQINLRNSIKNSSSNCSSSSSKYSVNRLNIENYDETDSGLLPMIYSKLSSTTEHVRFYDGGQTPIDSSYW